MNIKRERCPSHPGAILRELYLKPLNISVAQFAKDIGISQKIVTEIINEKTSVTSDLAFRFSKAFPNSTFYSWVGLQKEYDNWHNTPRTCQFDAYRAEIEEGHDLWKKENS